MDDDPAVLQTLSYVFEERYDIITASSGLAALRIVREVMPDLVICDQRMPGMAGHEVCERLAKIAPRIPRIVLTAYADIEEAAKAINSGKISGYFRKPFNPDVLAEGIDKLLERRSSAPSVIDPTMLEQLETQARHGSRDALSALHKAQAACVSATRQTLRTVT